MGSRTVADAFFYTELSTYSFCIHSVPTVQFIGLEPSIPTVNYTVNFPVSDFPQSQTFTLTPVDDNVPSEPNEVIRLVLIPTSNSRVAQDDPAEVVIVDDDVLGQFVPIHVTSRQLCALQ